MNFTFFTKISMSVYSESLANMSAEIQLGATSACALQDTNCHPTAGHAKVNVLHLLLYC